MSALILLAALAWSAFVPLRTVAAESTTRVTLESFQVPDTLKAGKPYAVTLGYRIDGTEAVRITKACFTWSGEGPYCFSPTDSRAAATVTVRLKTGNAGTYLLAGFVRYSVGLGDYESNTLSSTIVVRP